MQCVMYFILAVYLDNVIGDSNGAAQPLWYFLMPSYWSPNKVSPNPRCLRLNTSAHTTDAQQYFIFPWPSLAMLPMRDITRAA